MTSNKIISLYHFNEYIHFNRTDDKYNDYYLPKNRIFERFEEIDNFENHSDPYKYYLLLYFHKTINDLLSTNIIKIDRHILEKKILVW